MGRRASQDAARRPTREELFARDGYRCVYCGEVFPAEALSVDHVQARVRGGDNSGGNVVTACGGCNLRKGHRRLADFLADEPEASANFHRYARHVWPRHLRTLAEEMARRRPAARPAARPPRPTGPAETSPLEPGGPGGVGFPQQGE